MSEEPRYFLVNLVPPLDLCGKIPEGAFTESALVWTPDDEGVEIVLPREIVAGFEIAAPAPTLAEILEDLAGKGVLVPSCTFFQGRDKGWYAYGMNLKLGGKRIMDSRPETAVLKLWLELYEKEGAK